MRTTMNEELSERLTMINAFASFLSFYNKIGRVTLVKLRVSRSVQASLVAMWTEAVKELATAHPPVDPELIAFWQQALESGKIPPLFPVDYEKEIGQLKEQSL